MYRKFNNKHLRLNCISGEFKDEIDFDVIYKTMDLSPESDYYPAVVMFHHCSPDLIPKFMIIYQCECTFALLSNDEKVVNIATTDGHITIWDWIMSSYRMSFKELIVYDDDYFKQLGLTRDMIGAQHE